MGYNISFDGELTIIPAISLKDAKAFEADFDPTNNVFSYEDFETGQRPKTYCLWGISEEGTLESINHGNSFHHYTEWLAYIIETFFKPKGYTLNGEILWDGEERGDIGTISVQNNHLIIVEGK